MTTSQQRAALAALDQARPAIGRLDLSRDPEDLAADIIEGWQAAETALRALIGSASLSGQPLIREVRQRELLTLDQAHALVEFSAAHERAQRTDYRPTSCGHWRRREPATSSSRQRFGRSAPRRRRCRLPPLPRPRRRLRPQTARVSGRRDDGADFRSSRSSAFSSCSAGIGGGIYYFTAGRSGGALEQGIAAYACRAITRRRATRSREAIRDDPKDADPHIYLGRMAREEGDANTAVRELQTAIQLEPNNATAQREMGAHLLAQATGTAERRQPSWRAAVAESRAQLLRARGAARSEPTRLRRATSGACSCASVACRRRTTSCSAPGPGAWTAMSTASDAGPAGAGGASAGAVIELSHVSKTYAPRFGRSARALDDVSFELRLARSRESPGRRAPERPTLLALVARPRAADQRHACASTASSRGGSSSARASRTRRSRSRCRRAGASPTRSRGSRCCPAFALRDTRSASMPSCASSGSHDERRARLKSLSPRCARPLRARPGDSRRPSRHRARRAAGWARARSRSSCCAI